MASRGPTASLAMWLAWGTPADLDFVGGTRSRGAGGEVVVRPRCGVCSEPMPQLMQIDAPCNGWQRVLHIFACQRSACGEGVRDGAGRWRVLRSQCAAAEPAEGDPALPPAAAAVAAPVSVRFIFILSYD